MKTFEVLPVDFDGSTDEKDHLILWINANNKTQIESMFKRMGWEYQDILQIDYLDSSLESAVDFTLYDYDQDINN